MASDAEQIVGLYQRHAQAWARDRGNSLSEKAWLDRFLRLLPSGASVLDIGCGSGEPIGRYLVESGCAVTGIDSSPGLIAMCQALFPDHAWHVADMRALSLPDIVRTGDSRDGAETGDSRDGAETGNSRDGAGTGNSRDGAGTNNSRGFDGILAWDSFFHLCHDHQRRMFPVFKAHASARAALMFTSGPSHGVAIGAYQGEKLYHASLDSDEYRALLDENGFEEVSHIVEDPACGGHTVWLAQARPERPKDP